VKRVGPFSILRFFNDRRVSSGAQATAARLAANLRFRPTLPKENFIMATEDQTAQARRSAGVTGAATARNRCTRAIDLTVSGNTTVKDSTITLPAGSYFRAVTLDTPTAISGSPTTCNVRVGTTDTGQDVVADVDAKAQGHISATIVASLDKVGAFALATTLFAQVTTSGGSGSAGTIRVLVDYDAPVF
jgi:hypothetical protein